MGGASWGEKPELEVRKPGYWLGLCLFDLIFPTSFN